MIYYLTQKLSEEKLTFDPLPTKDGLTVTISEEYLTFKDGQRIKGSENDHSAGEKVPPSIGDIILCDGKAYSILSSKKIKYIKGPSAYTLVVKILDSSQFGRDKSMKIPSNL